MKSLFVIALVVLAACPPFAAESVRGQSGPALAQTSHQGTDDGTSDIAAAILAARQKAVDDLRAGRTAPYYFAAPQAPAPATVGAQRSALNVRLLSS
jgi:hypothetical protein